MNLPALSFERVTRRFGHTTAVDRLSLRVEPGTVLGLLGRNGAGKTTSLRLAHGLLYPDGGRIEVLGLDPQRQGLELRERVGLLSEEAQLYPWMTVGEILRFGAALHPRWSRQMAQSLVERLHLDPTVRIQTLSRGTRAKVALVLAVAARPELLLLDDPTAGLDPLVRREVLQGIIESLPAEGGSVIYASHLIHDVERVADRVVFLDEGRLTLEASLEELKQQVRRVRAVFDDGAPEGVEFPGLIDFTSHGRVASLVARGQDAELAASVRALGAREVAVEPLSLEEILLACLRPDDSEVRHV
jgi:ABC-2 type transport system ATP-binding protein